MLHKLCHYHNHKTALFYCVFLGPFRQCMGIDHMGMQMRVYSFWCLSLNLNSDTYPDQLLLQQAVLPEAVHLPSKHIQWDDHNSFSSGLVVFGVFLFFCLLFHCGLPLGIWQRRNGRRQNQVCDWGCHFHPNLYGAPVGQEKRLISKDMLGPCFVIEARVLLDFKQHHPMWAALPSILQYIFLAGNPTEVLKSF